MKYEELSHILKEEKKNTLSRILPVFYSDVNEYIKELETAEKNISKRHSEEAILIQYEIKNALYTIDKIFKKRTRKIIKIASARAFSKTPENIIHDIEHMTPHEHEVYHQIRNAIMKYKDASIDPILGNDNVSVPDIAPQAGDASTTIPVDDTGTPQASEENHPTAPDEITASHQPGDIEVPEPPTTDHTPPARDEAPDKSSELATVEKQPATIEKSVESGKNDINKEYIVVRLLKDIPEFVGADGNKYNPGAQDVAVLPKVNARALIKRKVAVQIESP